MEFSFVCTIDIRVLGSVLFGLAAFGYGYNRWVALVTAAGQDQGYLSFIVALGVAVTVFGFALAVWSWQVGLLLLICFIASGTPMILGSVGRYVQSRAREEAQAWMVAEQDLAGHER